MRDSMRRPVVGICTHLAKIRFGAWDDDAEYLGAEAVRAIQRAGAQVLLIPRDPGLIDEPADMLKRLDGLVVELPGAAAPPPAVDGPLFTETLGAHAERRGVPVLRIVHPAEANGGADELARRVLAFVSGLGR
jgi:gamma-glutamyl-gamma-aminobutyrate hydrolase PuuD